PRVARLSLGYAYLTEPTLADHALAGNDGGFEDVSDAARWRRRPFVPFTPMSGTEAHLVLGFDAPLGEGLVSLFIDAQGQPEGDAPSLSGSSFDWHYLSPTGWRPLSVYDETGGLKRPGLLQLVRPQDLVSDHAAMGERGSIRASLRQGEPMRPIPIGGVWLNAIWAAQREVVKSDIVGHADGRRSQVFELRRKLGSLLGPVTVDVREWVGEGRDWEHVAEKVEPSRLRLERDRATGAVTEVWIRWQQVAHFHDSGPTDRHYVVEVERGDIAFGDGEQGMLPPVGARIVAGYETGGGAVGNLPAGSVNRLSGMVPFVDGVTNPVPARGGADIERAERVEGRGPQHLRHRDRAVCEADYEWLATEASPAVLHARCDGLVGPAGFAQRGWVTLRVLPQGEGPRPEPSGELMRRVWQHLARRAPAVVAGRIRVLGPRYLPVGIEVRVAPQSVDVAAAVEARVRALLADFLHPTRGGPRGDGWRFGESLLASWIAMRLERLDGVDHATDLRLVVSGSIVEERVDVAADEIVAAGEQLVIMTLGAV
ncbi:MAG: putative baseplate assembly protein, partial [Myxococcales bacterium]|nr:putative baseplate assembly protein [Myxococcales bacterium]